ncbi:MAG: glucose-6-phosphate isomerase [Clostridia bacterium]
MVGISLDFSNADKFVEKEELEYMNDKVIQKHRIIEDRSGVGSEMLGWLDYAEKISEEEIEDIKDTAKKIQRQADVLVVVGIGGSYLGSRAVIDMLSDKFSHKKPEIIFAGNNMSGKYLRNLIEYILDKDVAVNVISKSGKTLEPAITFRILKSFLEEKYGEGGAADRIYITTDKEKGILKEIADKNQYKTFVIPDDIGGRYSVLTPVGLLPIAAAGLDINEILEGATFAKAIYSAETIEKNDAYKYAAFRQIFRNKGKDIEIMASYDQSLHYFVEWFKQLFGESEGKDGKGIFPVGVDFSTDLHSLGQIIQEGKRNVFETVLNIENTKEEICVPKSKDNFDGLEYLAGTTIDWINNKAFKGTVEAHVSGNVPNILINIKEINEYTVGQLIYFFEKACAMSAYLSEVNPFNQPGVEAYKNNMMSYIKEKENEYIAKNK